MAEIEKVQVHRSPEGYVPLKELIDLQFKGVDQRFAYLADAETARAEVLGHRLEVLNGEHKRLDDMQRKYVEQSVYDTERHEILAKIEELRSWKQEKEGASAGISKVHVVIVSIAGLILTALMIVSIVLTLLTMKK
jgi:hypothetical protein